MTDFERLYHDDRRQQIEACNELAPESQHALRNRNFENKKLIDRVAELEANRERAAMQLEDIQREMQKCSKQDPAKGHANSDGLLCDLATLLASRMDDETQQQVQQILQIYDNIKKWYA